MGKAEGPIEKHLTKRVKSAGGMCIKFSASIKNGVPDRVVILNGHTLFMEVKSTKGQPSEIQKFRIKEMRAAGARVYLPHSIEDVDTLVDQLLEHDPRGGERDESEW